MSVAVADPRLLHLTADREAATHRVGPARVLVVEADEAMRELVALGLRASGHAVTEASGGDEAIRQLLSEPPDLVILSVVLPDKDGWEVLRELKPDRRGVRILLLTAKASERDFLDGWRLGVDGYLTKPFEITDLLRAAHDLLTLPEDELRNRRRHELEKAELLAKLEGR